jgi:hypothetical protein
MSALALIPTVATLLVISAGACSSANAAQQAVGLGATVPAYCRIGTHAAAMDVPIVISVDAAGHASTATPAITIPGVLCNGAAKVVVSTRHRGATAATGTVAYTARIAFAGTAATLAAGSGLSTSATTDQAAKGALSITVTPAWGPGLAAADYTDTLHIALIAQ